MESFKVERYKTYPFNEVNWQDTELTGHDIRRKFKEFLRLRSTRMEILGELLQENDYEHLLDLQGHPIRSQEVMQALDAILSEAMIATWGNDRLPLTHDEKMALRELGTAENSPQTIGYTTAEAIELVARREEIFKTYHNQKTEAYNKLWLSIETDIGIYVFDYFLAQYPQFEWNIMAQSRSKNNMRARIPALMPINRPKRQYFPVAPVTSPLSLPHITLHYYRDGGDFKCRPNMLLQRFYSAFYPVSGTFSFLERLFEIRDEPEEKFAIFPDIPRSWIDQRNEIILKAERAGFRDDPHRLFNYKHLLDIPQHLRESGETY